MFHLSSIERSSRTCIPICAALILNASVVAQDLRDVSGVVEEIVEGPSAGAIVREETGHPVDQMGLIAQGLLPDGRIIVHDNRTEHDVRIAEALDVKTTVEFPGNPLSDVAEYLAQTHNIPILINKLALADIGFDDPHNVEVELVLSGISLSNLLNLMLEPHDLDYLVTDGVLLITSRADAALRMDTRVYNVRPLKVSDPETLADVLIYTTGGTSWKEFGGEGGLSFFNGSFVIRQNQQTHAQIERVLNQLAADVQNSAESPNWDPKQRPLNDVSVESDDHGAAPQLPRPQLRSGPQRLNAVPKS